MKIILLIIRNAFVVYTTMWAVFAAANFYGLSSPKDHGWLGQFAHIAVSLVLAFGISLDDILTTAKKHQKSNIQKYFEGIWESEIYDHENNIIKKDIWDFSTKNEIEVLGTIKRKYPQNDRAREWVFSGYFVPDQMQVAFTQKDPTGRSRGCAILKKSLEADRVFDGFYYKFNDAGSNDRTKIKLIKKE